MDIKALRVRKGKKFSLDAIPADSTFNRTKEDAERELPALHERLCALQDKFFAEKTRALLLVFQGMDCSGKNGVIKHALAPANPAGYQIASFKRPTDEECSRDFLWRIHQKVPEKGFIGVFNRSHYEDILVPMVHETLSKEVLEQRLKHIHHFEKLLADSGTRIVKFFLHLSKDKQLERLQERLKDPEKMWKFDEADITERQHWSSYQKAYEWILEKESESYAPWYVIPSDHRWVRNLVTLKIVVDTLSDMAPEYPIGKTPRASALEKELPGFRNE